MLPFFKKSSKNSDSLLIFLKNTFGIRVNTPILYQKAFNHKSAVSKTDTVTSSNERLEFLGDAVLDLLVSELLYERLPHYDEGRLTKIRSGFVSRENLNQIGEDLNLHTQVKYKGNSSNFKSLHGNLLESLIGAIYLDQGYLKTRKIVRTFIISPYLSSEKLEDLTIDFKSRLYMWAQKEQKNVEFKVLEERIQNKRNYFVIALFINDQLFATTEGYTKKEAEKILSEKAAKAFDF